MGAFVLFPRNAGFLPLLRISVSVSGAGNAGFWEPVFALEISVPRSVGDRFDDWVVGPQFEPYSLHHPALANPKFPALRQIGRFCGDYRHPNSRILVSTYDSAFEWGLLAPRLRIQKFRSRRPGPATNSDSCAGRTQFTAFGCLNAQPWWLRRIELFWSCAAWTLLGQSSAQRYLRRPGAWPCPALCNQPFTLIARWDLCSGRRLSRQRRQ